MARSAEADVLFVNLPSPPYRDVLREYAGGFGISLPSARPSIGHGPFNQPYLASVYAATLSRDAGFSVGFLDAQAESLGWEEFERRVVAARPQVIVAPMGLPSLDFDRDHLGLLKRSTGASVVAFGTVCRPEETLDDVLRGGAVDVAVTGDLETIVVRLLDALLNGEGPAGVEGCAYRGPGGGVTREAPVELEDLETLPIPAFDMLPMHRYVTWEYGRSHRVLGREFGRWPRYFTLYMSRGCPHTCEYCPYPFGWGRRWRRKSVEHVIAEMDAIARTGTRYVLLRDQTVSERVEYLESVCEGLIQAGVEVRWGCEARVGSLSRHTLGLMRRAGCVRIHYGVETGDPTLFAKTAKRGIAAEAVERGLRETTEAGILPSLHFLVGFPEDSWRSIAASLDLIERYGVRSGDCAIMTPYPGTRFYERVRDEGKLLADTWDEYTGCDPIVAIDGLSPVELVAARWRILQAIRQHNRRGLRTRLSAASRVFAAKELAPEPAAAIDAAIEKAFGRDGSGRVLEHPSVRTLAAEASGETPLSPLPQDAPVAEGSWE